jgi:hypothetical protein
MSVFSLLYWLFSLREDDGDVEHHAVMSRGARGIKGAL